jgi:hypothetical protein
VSDVGDQKVIGRRRVINDNDEQMLFVDSGNNDPAKALPDVFHSTMAMRVMIIRQAFMELRKQTQKNLARQAIASNRLANRRGN